DPKLAFVDFSSPIVPKNGSVSFAVWITASSVHLYARVIDIGDKEGVEGRAFIYLVARHDEDKSRAAITMTDTNEKTYTSGDPLDDGKPHMAVLVIDGSAKKLHLYVDGKETAGPEFFGENSLEHVRPAHNWIGRSAFDENPGLSASIDEFRVYDHALSADEVS